MVEKSNMVEKSKMLEKKIDFVMTIVVNGANPNGDPLAGNMPRTDSQGFGEISDVCIKRKIRNRMQDMGHEIFVKSNERIDDGFKSLESRYNSILKSEKDDQIIADTMCKKWIDVRTFGQVVTYNKKSVAIRGPVSISIAKSLEPITISSMQIVKSTNGMEKDNKKEDESSKSSDTMGSKHYVEFGTYLVYGAVNSFFSEKVGYTEEDLKVLKDALITLFVNDSSSARPEGSMEVKELHWFEHSSKLGNVSSAKIRELFTWDKSDTNKEKYEDYQFSINEDEINELKEKGLKHEKIVGM